MKVESNENNLHKVPLINESTPKNIALDASFSRNNISKSPFRGRPNNLSNRSRRRLYRQESIDKPLTPLRIAKSGFPLKRKHSQSCNVDSNYAQSNSTETSFSQPCTPSAEHHEKLAFDFNEFPIMEVSTETDSRDPPEDSCLGMNEIFTPPSLAPKPSVFTFDMSPEPTPKYISIVPSKRPGYERRISMLSRLTSHISKDSVEKVKHVCYCLGKKDEITSEIYERLESTSFSYRPYFTWWITLVQVVVFVVAVATHGLAWPGLSRQESATVRSPALVIESVCRWSEANPLVGPSEAALVRLGARFPPCMRFDAYWHQHVAARIAQHDRNSGCCIRNDGGGCYQSGSGRCSRTLAKWHGQTVGAGGKKRRSRGLSIGSSAIVSDHLQEHLMIQRVGPVCGLDPKFCLEPMQTKDNPWPEDISKWPVCERVANETSHEGVLLPEHMRCEITGRPCCVGHMGKCIVTTREHCSYLNGIYNPHAALCTQASCLMQMCSMIPFIKSDTPNQLYRLFTALFLHASLVHLLITLCVQLLYMRDLEKMFGWQRISLIYFTSGVIAHLFSGILLPYHVQTGPSASLMGIFGSTFVELFQCWRLIQHPLIGLAKQTAILVLLFGVGLLPWVDNYAHAAGFLIGLLVTYTVHPMFGFGSSESQELQRETVATPEASAGGAGVGVDLEDLFHLMYRRRLKCILVCVTLILSLGAGCLYAFYCLPTIICAWCKYLTCFPLSQDMCVNMFPDASDPSQCIRE